MSIKPLLFIDFDGTICHDRFWRSLDSESYQKVQNFLFQNNKQMVNDWMRGKYSSEEINQSVATNIGTPFEKLWTLFQKDCKTMNVPINILQKINALRDRFHVVLMTDNMDCFDRFTVPALGLQNYFDAIHNSSSTGNFKNDNKGKVFIEYAKLYETPIQRAILIDNSKSACSVFATLGGGACFVDETKNIEYHLQNI